MPHYVCSSCGTKSDVPDRCMRLGCDREDMELVECTCSTGPASCEMLTNLKSSGTEDEYMFDEWGEV